ncbi:MAG: cytochrome b [Pseudomonadota bacterium]
MAAATDRYTAVAVALHWIIAALILGQIAGGFYMHNLPNTAENKFQLYQLHKSFGITILLLSLGRLGWRIAHPAPPQPSGMPGWQRTCATVSHWGFYGLMIGVPLLGWAMVSASPWGIPTKLFGVVPWPHLPILSGLENKEPVEEVFKELHEAFAKLILLLLAVHVGAALKHHFVDKDGVLVRMIPALKPKA